MPISEVSRPHVPPVIVASRWMIRAVPIVQRVAPWGHGAASNSYESGCLCQNIFTSVLGLLGLFLKCSRQAVVKAAASYGRLTFSRFVLPFLALFIYLIYLLFSLLEIVVRAKPLANMNLGVYAMEIRIKKPPSLRSQR